MEEHLDLLNAMFFIESFDGKPFNPDARRNDKGTGKSISGVTESTWEELKQKGSIPAESQRYNPHDEVRAGVEYFKWLLERPYIAGEPRKAVAAYHMGPGALKRLTGIHSDDWEK